MGEPPTSPRMMPLRLRHVLLVYATPGSLFSRVEDSGGYGLPLVVLLALVTLLGYAQIQTGLIDQVVDQQTEQALAELENDQAQLVDRVQLKESMDAVRKKGEFSKMISRLGAVVMTPAYFIGSFLLIVSILYAVVALTGRKPEYHTLMSICVYAGFIELAAVALRLAMMVYYGSMTVDTSLAMLRGPGEWSWLGGIDPFRLWFWGLLAIGVSRTQQLSRRMAWLTCVLMCLVATGVRVSIAASI